MEMQIKQEAGNNRRWFYNGKVVSRYRMFNWLRENGLRPSQLTQRLVGKYITRSQAQGLKWEA